jgi:hypothetical protein
MKIDRSACSTALAKSIAYRNIGRDHDAQVWAQELFRLLMGEEKHIVAPMLTRAAPATGIPMRLVGSQRA